MNIHKNARLTPKGREILVCRIVNEGLRVEEARAGFRSQRTHGLQVAVQTEEFLESLLEWVRKPIEFRMDG